MVDPAHRDGPTVLVADDDAEWRTLLRYSLEQAGFQVLEASRGDSALTLAERQPPDVVVLDHEMPGLNGLDVITGLRRRWPTLPIVLTSAFGDPRIVEQAMGRGASRYLDKPFHLAALVAEILTLLRINQPR
jgi:DNA-binding response OmpR family regulator